VSIQHSGPGAVRLGEGPIILNGDRPAQQRRTLVVVNTGDRPIQIGSHIHLAEVNAALAFDRALAQGFRLDIAAGTSRRFEPGASREVDIVAFGGRGLVPGIQIKES
jgi:urease subunit beta